MDLMKEEMASLNAKEVVDILMESAFYFDLNLKERRSLIRHIIEISSGDPFSGNAAVHWI
jgi:hypothetical protein